MLRPLSCLSHATSSTATRISVFGRAAAAAASQSQHQSRRAQSSTSRTKKMLNIPPHPDFLTPREGHNYILYNPPSSAPSVYHTPFKFLPKSDPRRQANLGQLIMRSSSDPHANADEAAAAAGDSWSSMPLPPPAHRSESHVKKYNVTQDQVEEMRELRASDPITWSVHRLAEKFDCSNYFVMMCCKASREHKDRERERLDAIKARWGPIRAHARDERKKRKELLLRGAL